MIETKPPVFAETLSRQTAQRRLALAFADAGLETAEIDARLLLCAALGIDHVSLVRDPDLHIGAAGAAIEALCARRLEFEINGAVRDPRPDTETLIAAALDLMRERSESALRLLDLGTGSGAILAALLSVFPNATGVGIDISYAAAGVAKANLERLGLDQRGFVVCGDWTAAVRGPFDLIVANPPYIARGSIADLAADVRVYEPHLALDGGEDGLEAYRILAPAVAGLLAPNGCVAFECGAGQSLTVEALLEAAGLLLFRARRDLAGLERVVTAGVAI
jgi:release factor glutamine methyltransferase